MCAVETSSNNIKWMFRSRTCSIMSRYTHNTFDNRKQAKSKWKTKCMNFGGCSKLFVRRTIIINICCRELARNEWQILQSIKIHGGVSFCCSISFAALNFVFVFWSVYFLPVHGFRVENEQWQLLWSSTIFKTSPRNECGKKYQLSSVAAKIRHISIVRASNGKLLSQFEGMLVLGFWAHNRWVWVCSICRKMCVVCVRIDGNKMMIENRCR